MYKSVAEKFSTKSQTFLLDEASRALPTRDTYVNSIQICLQFTHFLQFPTRGALEENYFLIGAMQSQEPRTRGFCSCIFVWPLRTLNFETYRYASSIRWPLSSGKNSGFFKSWIRNSRLLHHSTLSCVMVMVRLGLTFLCVLGEALPTQTLNHAHGLDEFDCIFI